MSLRDKDGFFMLSFTDLLSLRDKFDFSLLSSFTNLMSLQDMDGFAFSYRYVFPTRQGFFYRCLFCPSCRDGTLVKKVFQYEIRRAVGTLLSMVFKERFRLAICCPYGTRVAFRCYLFYRSYVLTGQGWVFYVVFHRSVVPQDMDGFFMLSFTDLMSLQDMDGFAFSYRYVFPTRQGFFY
jgi:hypothetical protein